MNMQDKELDNLFRSKLDSFEAEPSANVWQNIDAGLHTKKRKTILVPLLSAAASIIILVTAGVLFIPHHINHPVSHSPKGGVAKNNVPSKAPETAPVHQASQIAQVNTSVKPHPVKLAVALQLVKKQPLPVQPLATNLVTNQQPASVQPTVTQSVQQTIAEVPQKHDEVIQPKPVDSAVLVANNTATTDIKPVKAVVPDKPIVAKTTAQPPKKHHIHSLGDMLNTVIAAVDKRKDKLIEFTDTDDDESVITGVNLGIVAVKKQN